MTYERPAIVDRTSVSDPVIAGAKVNSDSPNLGLTWAPHDEPYERPAITDRTAVDDPVIRVLIKSDGTGAGN